jgi:hypothetical protein
MKNHNTVKHLSEPYLQESGSNQKCTCFIPTIVNGEIITSSSDRSIPRIKDNMEEVQNNLSKFAVNLLKKRNKHLRSLRHKIVLIGDSHIRGYARNVKTLLSNNFELYSVVKPGSSSSDLKETAKEEISKLTYDDDFFLICIGTNDLDIKKSSLAFQNISNFVTVNDHTNIILVNVPYRYDVMNCCQWRD